MKRSESDASAASSSETKVSAHGLGVIGGLVGGAELGAMAGQSPLAAIHFAQFANGLLLPLVAVYLLGVMNSRRLLGNYKNGWRANLLGVTVVLFVVGLGIRNIVNSVEQIRASAEKVKKSTEEQAAGSAMISETTTQTHLFSQQIKSAMLSEQEASGSIVRSLRNISEAAEGSLSTAQAMEQTVTNFAALAEKLAMEIERFRLPEESVAAANTQEKTDSQGKRPS